MLYKNIQCSFRWSENNTRASHLKGKSGKEKSYHTKIGIEELISGHMVAIMLDNTKTSLKRYSTTSCHGWLDITVALYWIQDLNQYKHFMANRVRNIREKKDISWNHVLTDQNPSDQGSRGAIADKLEDLWF